MYEKFFNFGSKPFDLLPNPDLLYMSRTHGKALSYLRYGIEERAGFILLTGDVGAGKTTLIRLLIKDHLDKVILSKVTNTKVDSHQLLTMINDDFGLETEGRTKAALVRELNEFLIDQYALGKRCVLIIDEAQNLSAELLEEVRMLSNLETDGGKLLQIILAGQPELKETLNSHTLLQLRQRIQIGCHLSPLKPDEVRDYILYRMECAGNREAVNFSDEAFALIAEQTRGVPRLINILCDYLLIDAFAAERREVGEQDVTEILEELDFERQYWPEKKNQRPVSGMVQSRGRGVPGQAQKVLRAIRTLEDRMDYLERQENSNQPASMVGLLDRIEELEKQVALQRQQLEGLRLSVQNRAMLTRMETLARPAKEPEQPRKRSWAYRLLFGGE
ncbi:secretion ATPase, PEP-CTERM locus subfamily [Pseudodesulfovibrio mercurii]|uniref:Secretion ATPase, PEP-CTERM locus subfamily n=1 Tax=Pseudodesulfovibrio mercurii TaxID=641491 RepID=F0JCB7_9BACT|nr:XrtA/PEP-CTERM system-associated ATPase [Pseudodesulfovibrio mercurii]EGB14415.1 secretion ATPase, PEP-CTERM locus subfamily [Pseudodesulfovibrio mercurii]